MKTTLKLILAVCLAAPLLATLSGCAGPTLEQQIAIKEPGSWDFQQGSPDKHEYVRIFDGPGKVGWIKYEYGQKHPCNQGFQKAIKTVAPGLVQYLLDPSAKSFACNEKTRLMFKTDSNGQPYEGWYNVLKDSEKKDFTGLESSALWTETKGILPTMKLVK